MDIKIGAIFSLAADGGPDGFPDVTGQTVKSEEPDWNRTKIKEEVHDPEYDKVAKNTEGFPNKGIGDFDNSETDSANEYSLTPFWSPEDDVDIRPIRDTDTPPSLPLEKDTGDFRAMTYDSGLECMPPPVLMPQGTSCPDGEPKQWGGPDLPKAITEVEDNFNEDLDDSFKDPDFKMTESDVQSSDEFDDNAQGKDKEYASDSSDWSDVIPTVKFPPALNKSTSSKSLLLSHNVNNAATSRSQHSPSSIEIQGTNNCKDKRVWDKIHFCFYCKCKSTNITKHYLGPHRNEHEVKKVLDHPKKSKERSLALLKLRNAGDFQNNMSVLKNGKGTLITWARPDEENTTYKDYLPCEDCQAFFLRSNLWRHRQVCPFITTKTKNQKVQSQAQLLLPASEEVSSGLKENVISKMACDEVTNAVRNDSIIVAVGEQLFRKHGHLPHLNTYMSQKMRELGRFLIKAREIDPKIISLKCVMTPEKYPVAIKATRLLCKYKEDINKYSNPSLALKLGHLLKKCAKIQKSSSLIECHSENGRKADEFLSLVEAEWTGDISSSALQTLASQKINKGDMLPISEDILKLQVYFNDKTKNITDQLVTTFSKTGWDELNQMTLARIVLFNRRRGCETERITLEAYDKRLSKSDILREFELELSPVEKMLCSTFERIEVRGKKGRTVPVLLTPEILKCIDLLLKWRKEANVDKNNPFLFPRPNNSLQALRTTDVLRKFARLANLKHPNNLTSTKLRKHVATVSQILNLSKNDLEVMANFMGHDIEVHRSFYRIPQETLQVARMGKLLSAFDRGTISKYSGKSLDNISLNEELSSEDEYDDDVLSNDDTLIQDETDDPGLVQDETDDPGLVQDETDDPGLVQDETDDPGLVSVSRSKHTSKRPRLEMECNQLAKRARNEDMAKDSCPRTSSWGYRTSKKISSSPKQDSSNESTASKKKASMKIYPCFIVLTKIDKYMESRPNLSHRRFRRIHQECPNICKNIHFRRKLRAGLDVFNVKVPSKSKGYQTCISMIKKRQNPVKSNPQTPAYTDLLKKYQETVHGKRIERVMRSVHYMPKDFVKGLTKGSKSPAMGSFITDAKQQVLNETEREINLKREVANLKNLISFKRSANKTKKLLRRRQTENVSSFVKSRTSGRLVKVSKRYANDFAMNKDEENLYLSLSVIEEKMRRDNKRVMEDAKRIKVWEGERIKQLEDAEKEFKRIHEFGEGSKGKTVENTDTNRSVIICNLNQGDRGRTNAPLKIKIGNKARPFRKYHELTQEERDKVNARRRELHLIRKAKDSKKNSEDNLVKMDIACSQAESVVKEESAGGQADSAVKEDISGGQADSAVKEKISGGQDDSAVKEDIACGKAARRKARKNARRRELNFLKKANGSKKKTDDGVLIRDIPSDHIVLASLLSSDNVPNLSTKPDAPLIKIENVDPDENADTVTQYSFAKSFLKSSSNDILDPTTGELFQGRSMNGTDDTDTREESTIDPERAKLLRIPEKVQRLFVKKTPTSKPIMNTYVVGSQPLVRKVQTTSNMQNVVTIPAGAPSQKFVITTGGSLISTSNSGTGIGKNQGPVVNITGGVANSQLITSLPVHSTLVDARKALMNAVVKVHPNTKKSFPVPMTVQNTSNVKQTPSLQNSYHKSPPATYSYKLMEVPTEQTNTISTHAFAPANQSKSSFYCFQVAGKSVLIPANQIPNQQKGFVVAGPGKPSNTNPPVVVHNNKAPIGVVHTDVSKARTSYTTVKPQVVELMKSPNGNVFSTTPMVSYQCETHVKTLLDQETVGQDNAKTAVNGDPGQDTINKPSDWAPTVNSIASPAVNPVYTTIVNPRVTPAVNPIGTPPDNAIRIAAFNSIGTPPLNSIGTPPFNLIGTPTVNLIGTPAVNPIKTATVSSMVKSAASSAGNSNAKPIGALVAGKQVIRVLPGHHRQIVLGPGSNTDSAPITVVSESSSPMDAKSVVKVINTANTNTMVLDTTGKTATLNRSTQNKYISVIPIKSPTKSSGGGGISSTVRPSGKFTLVPVTKPMDSTLGLKRLGEPLSPSASINKSSSNKKPRPSEGNGPSSIYNATYVGNKGTPASDAEPSRGVNDTPHSSRETDNNKKTHNVEVEEDKPLAFSEATTAREEKLKKLKALLKVKQMAVERLRQERNNKDSEDSGEEK